MLLAQGATTPNISRATASLERMTAGGVRPAGLDSLLRRTLCLHSQEFQGRLAGSAGAPQVLWSGLPEPAAVCCAAAAALVPAGYDPERRIMRTVGGSETHLSGMAETETYGIRAGGIQGRTSAPGASEAAHHRVAVQPLGGASSAAGAGDAPMAAGMVAAAPRKAVAATGATSGHVIRPEA
jgi:hypothetical protein